MNRILVTVSLAALLTQTSASCAFAADSSRAGILARWDELRDGETLTIERGTYHFGEKDARMMFLSPSNNGAGEKFVIFPLAGRKRLTFDGNGSTLVFHGRSFPFAVTNSTDLAFRNFTVTTHHPSCAGFSVTEKDKHGFTLLFDEGVAPFSIHDDQLDFDLDGNIISTRNGRFSLHSLDRLVIRYLMTPSAPGDKSKFPAPFIGARPIAPDGRKIRFAYTGDTHPLSIAMPYNIGERVVVNLEEKRNRMVFFFEDCERIKVENIIFRRFGGMGVVAQRSGDIELTGLCATPIGESKVTLTADIVQCICCWGKVKITNCRGGYSLDDWINIHGNYLGIESRLGRQLRLKVRHDSHRGFFPYRVGDAVEIVTAHERKVLARAHVANFHPDASDPTACTLTVDSDLPSGVVAGLLVENASLHPNILIVGNHFNDYPNIRLSGRGKILVRKNRFERGSSALLGFDLADYWSESGRILDMTISDNEIIDCGGMNFGLSGWSDAKAAPKVHGRIQLKNNRFDRVRGAKWSVLGVESFTCE